MSIRLLDAERAERLGELRGVPSPSARNNLAPGARVGLLVQDGGERATRYVTVTARTARGYQGTPDNSEDFGGQRIVPFTAKNVVEAGLSGRRILAWGLLGVGAAGLVWDVLLRREPAQGAQANQAPGALGAAPMQQSPQLERVADVLTPDAANAGGASKASAGLWGYR
jgi:hypothetical protein